MNSSWKVPVGYFFINGLDGKEDANLVKLCIKKLDDVGVDVISLTCDGPSYHFAMLRELGAKMSPPNLKPYFVHILSHFVWDKKKVYVLLDMCHMLKLTRNTLADGGILVDGDGHKTCWEYITALQKLQESEGLRSGNKLKQVHINWWQQKMKVNLAAQTFSASVADAIDYCRDTLKLPEFQGSQETVAFMRTFDHVFDVLNSRNPCAKGYKAPLCKSNQETWAAFLEEVYTYIMGLHNTAGTLMYKTCRKTRFVGFLVEIKSMEQIFSHLVDKENATINYVLTYKFSQDHLELFSGAIRSSGGFNNNLTAQQFTAAYKRLCYLLEVVNCQKQDNTDILKAIGDSYKTKNQTVTVGCCSHQKI